MKRKAILVKKETNKSMEGIIDAICSTLQREKENISVINYSPVSSITIKTKIKPDEIVSIEVTKEYVVFGVEETYLVFKEEEKKDV